MRKPVCGRYDTNRSVQPQKMATGLKFQIEEEVGLYYLHVCCENKKADQLCCYSAADLRL